MGPIRGNEGNPAVRRGSAGLHVAALSLQDQIDEVERAKSRTKSRRETPALAPDAHPRSNLRWTATILSYAQVNGRGSEHGRQRTYVTSSDGSR